MLLPFTDGDTTFRLLVVGGEGETQDNHTVHGDEDPATDTAVVFEYNSLRPLDQQAGWRRTGSMQNARVLCDATLLPDGNVVVTGGATKGWTNRSYRRWAVFEAELYNPHSGVFTRLASARLDRRYHSTALLLPDGTILKMGSTGGFVAGNDGNGDPWIQPHTEAERFFPPYLWRSPRPTMRLIGVSDSGITRYGSRIEAEVTGYDVRSVRLVLMRNGAVTHGLDMDQRHVTLRVDATSDAQSLGRGRHRVRVGFRAPSAPTVAPPGDYMVFAIDGWDVPSEGYFLRLSRD